MPKVQITDLCKSYGSLQVLKNISLTLEPNEFTVLVGPSGCGKSTLLRSIAGLEDIISGEIFMDDRPISQLEPKDRDIAMVFQDYALYPHMNVAQNMSFALKLQGVKHADRMKAVRNVADMLDLSDYLTRKPAELSGGQRQRVAMGRALTRDSGTFLFDEPLSNLDAKLRGQMRAELALIRNRVQKNFIYVTHDQIEAMTLADRIVVMKQGVIQQEGSPEDLFRRPKNMFVAGFLGSPPMNFLEASVVEQDGAIELHGQGFALKTSVAGAAKIRTAGLTSLTLGIRPSDLRFDVNADDGRLGLKMTILVSEYIGSQSVLLCDLHGQKVMVEVQSLDRIALNQTIRFQASPEELYLFDTHSGEAL